jgi:hypothetical protein
VPLSLTTPFAGAGRVAVVVASPSAYCRNDTARMRGSAQARVRCLQVGLRALTQLTAAVAPELRASELASMPHARTTACIALQARHG